MRTYSDPQHRWTHIVPRAFYRADRAGLLCYEQDTGFAVLFDVDDEGALVNARQHAGWRARAVLMATGVIASFAILISIEHTAMPPRMLAVMLLPLPLHHRGISHRR